MKSCRIHYVRKKKSLQQKKVEEKFLSGMKEEGGHFNCVVPFYNSFSLVNQAWGLTASDQEGSCSCLKPFHSEVHDWAKRLQDLEEITEKETWTQVKQPLIQSLWFTPWINLTAVTQVLKQGQSRDQNHVLEEDTTGETHFLCLFCWAC